MILHEEDILGVLVFSPLALHRVACRLFHPPLVALILLLSSRLLALLWRVDL